MQSHATMYPVVETGTVETRHVQQYIYSQSYGTGEDVTPLLIHFHFHTDDRGIRRDGTEGL